MSVTLLKAAGARFVARSSLWPSLPPSLLPSPGQSNLFHVTRLISCIPFPPKAEKCGVKDKKRLQSQCLTSILATFSRVDLNCKSTAFVWSRVRERGVFYSAVQPWNLASSRMLTGRPLSVHVLHLTHAPSLSVSLSLSLSRVSDPLFHSILINTSSCPTRGRRSPTSTCTRRRRRRCRAAAARSLSLSPLSFWLALSLSRIDNLLVRPWVGLS